MAQQAALIQDVDQYPGVQRGEPFKPWIVAEEPAMPYCWLSRGRICCPALHRDPGVGRRHKPILLLITAQLLAQIDGLRIHGDRAF